jgi:hypothetical protein
VELFGSLDDKAVRIIPLEPVAFMLNLACPVLRLDLFVEVSPACDCLDHLPDTVDDFGDLCSEQRPNVRLVD